MLKLKRSKSQIIDNNTILNSLNEFAPKTRESIKPIESLNRNAYYPRRSRSSFTLSKLGYKPYIDYDQNLTFENAIDQIFEGLDQADIDAIKNHDKWNENVSDVGLPKVKCLQNLQILASIIQKKKANSPESTKAIQEGVMSNVRDFLQGDGCYANLIARLESYRITNLESLVISNALYQYILASGGLLTHFHDYPLSHYTQYPLKKSPINSRANNNITVRERDPRDIPNHDVKYFDEYIEFMHKSMKSIASVVTPEEIKDFILKNLATKLGYQDVQYKSLKPDSDIKDLVEQYDKDLEKYHKSFNEVFEPKISDDSENDKDILEFIKEAIAIFDQKKNMLLRQEKPWPLIQDFLNQDYLSGLVNYKPDLDADAKNKLKAKIENLNLQAIISEYSQYKISKTKPDIALICKKNSKEDLAYKAEKYIKYRDEFPEKQRKEKEEVLKNLAENGYLDDISNDQEKENELTNYIPSKKLLNCVLNPNQSSKNAINDYVDAFIPTLHLFDKKSRDQQEENNRILNNVNFQPPERRIGDRDREILTAFFVSLAFIFAGLLIGSITASFSSLIVSICFGLGAISLATTVFVGVKTFLKNRSNNECNLLSKDTCDRLKNQIKEKLKSVKDLARLVKNEKDWNEFIAPSLELKGKIKEIERLYNINIDDLYNKNIQSIRQSLINRFVINDMVEYRMRHPIQPNNKVPLDNLDPSVNDINEDRNLDSTGKGGLVQKYEKTLSHNILSDIVVEDFDATKNPSSQRTIQSAKSSLRNNETVANLNLNDAEKLPHEIKIPGNKNIYERLAKNNPQVKVQNYILSEKQRSLTQMYGDQKTSPLAQYRDLMDLNGNKSEVKTLNDLQTFQGKVKKINATFVNQRHFRNSEINYANHEIAAKPHVYEF